MLDGSSSALKQNPSSLPLENRVAIDAKSSHINPGTFRVRPGVVGGLVAVQPAARQPLVVPVESFNGATQHHSPQRRRVRFEGHGHRSAHKDVSTAPRVDDQPQGRSFGFRGFSGESAKPPTPALALFGIDTIFDANSVIAQHQSLPIPIGIRAVPQ